MRGVAILNAQRRQGIRLSPDMGFIKAGQLASQDADTDAVADDVMKGEEHYVVRAVQPQYFHPHQRALRQVERAPRFLASQFLRLRFRPIVAFKIH